ALLARCEAASDEGMSSHSSRMRWRGRTAGARASRVHARIRFLVALVLFGLMAAPMVHASLAATTRSHACCPDGTPSSDAPPSCQFVTPLLCCAQTAVPRVSAESLQLPAPVAVAIRRIVSNPLSPSCLSQPATQTHRPPIPPLLLKSVLIV